MMLLAICWGDNTTMCDICNFHSHQVAAEFDKSTLIDPPFHEDGLERLFSMFLLIDDRLARCEKSKDGDHSHADNLIDAQSEIMRAAAGIRARSTAGVLYKLALWRWDAPDIDDMTRYDWLAYSAFRDLAELLCEERVLKRADIRLRAEASQRIASDGL